MTLVFSSKLKMILEDVDEFKITSKKRCVYVCVCVSLNVLMMDGWMDVGGLTFSKEKGKFQLLIG